MCLAEWSANIDGRLHRTVSLRQQDRGGIATGSRRRHLLRGLEHELVHDATDLLVRLDHACIVEVLANSAEHVAALGIDRARSLTWDNVEQAFAAADVQSVRWRADALVDVSACQAGNTVSRERFKFVYPHLDIATWTEVRNVVLRHDAGSVRRQRFQHSGGAIRI
jgi:hypothetical protein